MFANDNFEFDENGRKFYDMLENTVEKRKNTSLWATTKWGGGGGGFGVCVCVCN